MQRAVIRFHNGVELEHAKAQRFCGLYAVRNEPFAYMLPAKCLVYGIAGVCDMPASADIVRMQNIQTHDRAAVSVLGDGSIRLLAEKLRPVGYTQALRLRECHAVVDDHVPYRYHRRYVGLFECPYSNFHIKISSGKISARVRLLFMRTKHREHGKLHSRFRGHCAAFHISVRLEQYFQRAP